MKMKDLRGAVLGQGLEQQPTERCDAWNVGHQKTNQIDRLSRWRTKKRNIVFFTVFSVGSFYSTMISDSLIEIAARIRRTNISRCKRTSAYFCCALLKGCCFLGGKPKAYAGHATCSDAFCTEDVQSVNLSQRAQMNNNLIAREFIEIAFDLAYSETDLRPMPNKTKNQSQRAQ